MISILKRALTGAFGRAADKQPEDPPEILPERTVRLLGDIDINRDVGLEIGPLDKPLVRRVRNRPIYYADYASRETLQHNSSTDASVDIQAIPEIDYVIQTLPTELDRRFDYIIASHVAEHVPDLIGWLTTLFGWLNPGGRVVLALPDKRRCFDVLRDLSTSGDMMEAFFEKRTKPNFGTIYDAMRLASHFDTARSWTETIPTDTLTPIFSPEIAFHTAEQARQDGRYQDCHCWVLTLESFTAAIDDINLHKVAAIRILRSEAPVTGSNEFHVALAPG